MSETKEKTKEKSADKERPLVERAENGIFQGLQFAKVEEAEEFANHVISSKWWKDNVQGITKVSLKALKDGQASQVKVSQKGYQVTVEFSKSDLMKEFIILSSMIRMSLSDKKDWNGKTYRKIILRATKEFLGPQSYNDLREAYKAADLAVA